MPALAAQDKMVKLKFYDGAELIEQVGAKAVPRQGEIVVLSGDSFIVEKVVHVESLRAAQRSSTLDFCDECREEAENT